MIDFEYKIKHDPANILQHYQLDSINYHGQVSAAALHILVTPAAEADLSNVIVGGAGL